MNGYIIIGCKASVPGNVIENIYTGPDGVAAQEAADEARKSGQWKYIGKLANPQPTPLPIDPTDIKVTRPTFITKRAAQDYQHKSAAVPVKKVEAKKTPPSLRRKTPSKEAPPTPESTQAEQPTTEDQ
jgi:hypothetical protein